VLEGRFEGLAPDGGLLLAGHPAAAFGDVFLEATHAAGG